MSIKLKVERLDIENQLLLEKIVGLEIRVEKLERNIKKKVKK